MKQFTKIGSLLALVATVGVLATSVPASAFAEGRDSEDSIGVKQHLEIKLNLRHENESDDDNWKNSTSTAPWERGEKKGLIKHFATTTPPGMVRHDDNSSRRHASSTENHVKDGLKLGLPSFLNWFFGLPATTTIGEIRANLQASTTASTTIPLPNSKELGLWAHFLGFLHLKAN